MHLIIDTETADSICFLYHFATLGWTVRGPLLLARSKAFTSNASRASSWWIAHAWIRPYDLGLVAATNCVCRREVDLVDNAQCVPKRLYKGHAGHDLAALADGLIPRWDAMLQQLFLPCVEFLGFCGCTPNSIRNEHMKKQKSPLQHHATTTSSKCVYMKVRMDPI
jgi:hypothetical protein